MKKVLLQLSSLLVSILICNGIFAAGGINTGGGTVPFGSNTQYNYGIMPTNLPSGGTYGQSQKAAEAYQAWKDAYVTSCGSGVYRVKFDDNSSTVSEGIAYGMLLSVYADDKDLFDGLWQYYQNNMNGNHVMNWKISGCSGVSGSNGATDAELDAAMALIIAAEQWGSSSYTSAAKALIQNIKTYEMASDGQTLNGDAWGNTNSCRNPSYFAPAYYAEFANVDTDNGTFWSTTAISASNKILSANMNSTSGLVSNWCDNAGTENSCGNTGSGAAGYGADACRNPWRMAVDYLWHGSSASTAAKSINAKLTSFVNGYESQLKGPFSNRSVSNPSSGSYINGSYSTFALSPMTSSSAQSSLNKCYTAVANLSNVDAYFNSTIRCITMFVLTGNFWAPGASGFVFPPSVSSAETDESGLMITLTMNKTMSAGSSSGSNFTVYYNGIAQSGIVSGVTVNSDKTVDLTLTTAPQPGQTILLSYNGNGKIKSAEDASLESFTKIEVLNMIAGNETILDDCEDGNEFNNVGGIWFTFNDEPDQTSACKSGTVSTITPLSSRENPLELDSPGYDNAGYAVHATYTLGSNYTPYSGGSCASWTNPAYVGIGTWVDDVETNTMDWTNGTGVTFWYKGPACSFQVIIEEVTDYCFHKYNVPECADWTQITVKWNELGQPAWGKAVDFTAKHVQKLQWQFETGVTGNAGASGNIWIDEVHILGMPPVPLTSLTISPISDSDLAEDDLSANIDPLKIPIASSQKGDTLYLETTPTPEDASYPVTFWSSSDEEVVTVDYKGRVIGVGYGEAIITARSKMHQDISATYTVKVPAPSVYPTAISFEESSYEVTVGETTTILAKFSPNGVTETGLTWTSSDNTVATVSSSGVVTGISEGTVTITATSKADGCSNIKQSVEVTVNPVAVTGISVDDEDVELELGQSAEVTATVTPSSVNQSVTAESSNESVATVSVSGSTITISSVGTGSATITVKPQADDSYSTTIDVTVTGVSITSVTITGDETAVYVGGNLTLSASILPAGATQTVVWSSSDETTATVTGGVVTGVAVGEVTITATSTEDNTKSDTYTVTVNAVPVASVTVSPSTKTLKVGEESQLAVSVKPDNAADKTVSWSSSDESVATVSSDGTVTAIKIGSATITATANDESGVSGTCEITVSATLVSSIAILPSAVNINTGDTEELTVTVLPADATDKTYTWSSSDESVATIVDGVVTAISAGTATITATAKDGSKVTGECVVTVEDVLPTSITMASTLGFTLGDDAQTLSPTVSPSNATNKAVSWVSSDETVATVVDGLVTPIGVGTCTITATSVAASTIVAECEVSVVASTINVTGVTLDASALVYYGQTTTLVATVAPEDATNKAVTWSSSDESIATVDANGVVTGVAIGTTTITVTTVDGSKIATCEVTVSHIAIESIAISGTGVANDALTLTLASSAVQLTASYLPENATDNKITWTSSDETVATVSSTGIVSPVAEGSTIITAKNGSVSAMVTVTITAVSIESVTLSESSIEMTVEDSPIELTATLLPENATNKTIVWTSSDETVATVVNGVITPVGVGSATIKAVASADATKYSECTVTVLAIPVTAVTIDKETAEISVVGTAVLTASIEPSTATDKTVTWSSSDESVATVANGVVTGVSAGTATITVTTTDGAKTATCDVTVKANTIAVAGVTLSPSITQTVALNESLSFTATIAPTNATNKAITWSSSDESVATVEDGVLTLLKTGVTTITVTTEDGNYTAQCDVTVTEIMTSTLVIDNALSMKVGETSTLSLTVVPEGASNTVLWSSSDESVASIVDGVVTAVKAGSASIIATATDGSDIFSNICEVTVSNIAVTAIAIDKESAVVRMGSSIVLNATVTPENATVKDVIWTSSKEAVATVDASGAVVAVSTGTTTVTAKSVEDAYIKATVSIEIVDASALQSEITDANTMLSSSVEGTEIGQYKTGAKATYQSAISAAQLVFDNEDATQEELDLALADLQSAGKTFAKALISNETLIFNADMSQENMTYMGTYWFSFNDVEPGGSSVVTPLSSEESPFTMSTPGYNGKGKAAMMEYTLAGQNDLGYNPFVGMGLNFDKTDNVPFDMTGSTGISFWIKSDSKVYFEVGMTTVTDACDYNIYLPAYPTWTLVELDWGDLAQYTWGEQVDWDLTQLTKCQWKVQEADGETGQVWVDEVKILGVALDLPEIIDYETLYTAIAEAQEQIDNAVVGTYDGNYPQSAVTALTSAIETATALIDNATAQSEVTTAVSALNKAINTFKESVIVVDRDALQATIDEADSKYAAAVEGYEEGLYLVGSKDILAAAITEARTVYASTEVDQSTVDDANTTLQEAIATFENSKYDPSAVNKTLLESLISEANTLYASSVEGLGDGQYPSGSKAVLQSAITSAETVNSNNAATQESVDAEVQELQTAIDAFKAQVITVDKTELTNIIKTATSLYSSSTEGIMKGNYPVGSKADLQAAITVAQSVNNGSSSSQSDVDAAVIQLQAAIDAFKALVITVDRTQLYYQLNLANEELKKADGNTGDGSGQYPQYAVTAFTGAISSAQSIYDVSTSQSDIDGAVTSLQSAITEFKNSINPDVVDISGLIALVDEADAILSAIPSNRESIMYEYIELVVARSTAKTEIERDSHTETNVNTQYKRLSEALEAFKAVAEYSTAIETVSEQALSMYPVPCQTTLTISAAKEIKTISIMNVTGKVVYVGNVADTEAELDVMNLKSGMYFTKIQYNDGSEIVKSFIKK